MLTFEKDVISVLSLLYLIGQPRDPFERIWTFICFFNFYFILFLLEGEERLGGLYIS